MAYPEGFEVPQDQGGPGEGNPVGGFGGNPQKTKMHTKPQFKVPVKPQ